MRLPNRVLPLLTMIALPGLLHAQEPRTLEFSGCTWEVRRSVGPEGPGPNRFLDNRRTVWVDDDGRLHLRAWQRLATAYAAEVVLSRPLGYGTYVIETIGALDDMAPTVIFGMFTYDRSPDHAHREIDIEYGRFGDAGGPNGQFVVQPFDVPENRLRFVLDQDGDYLTHMFSWQPERIAFASFHGHVADVLTSAPDPSRPAAAATLDSRVVARWEYGRGIPPPGEERFRLNLWHYQGASPGRDHEVVVASFAFVPYAGRAGE